MSRIALSEYAVTNFDPISGIYAHGTYCAMVQLVQKLSANYSAGA